jgi:acyl carrier protein
MIDHTVSPTEPLTEPSVIEHWIVEYLRKEFPRAEIGPETSFNAIALDSIVAVELTGFLENRLKQKVSPTLLYEFDTPRAVAASLTQSTSSRGENRP